jgi:hypothetical protein
MITLGELARAIEGAATDSAGTRIESVSTDSRTLSAGALFVALRGPRFDGHDYVQQARQRGAAALMVEHAVPVDLPQLRVPDARRALGRAAAHWRSGFSLPVVAVTGSNGKTTLTQMIGSIFAQAYGERGGRKAWLATRGNLNNDIGLPLMLFELAAHHRAAVFELGMNRAGEIAELAQMARPTLAVVNNAQREHQEFLQSPEATARENGAPRSGGIWRACAGSSISRSTGRPRSRRPPWPAQTAASFESGPRPVRSKRRWRWPVRTTCTTRWRRRRAAWAWDLRRRRSARGWLRFAPWPGAAPAWPPHTARS